MSKVVVYHFSTATCGPCKHIKPAIENLKEDNSDVEWNSVNLHRDEENYGEKFDVRMVPTMIVVGASGKVYRHTGTDMAGYYRIIRLAKTE